MKRRAFPVQGLISVLSVLAILAAWWIVTRLGLVRSIILPSPGEVYQGALDIWNGYLGVPFWNHFKASLSVMLVGYFTAVAIGVCAGVAMAWVPLLDKLFSPLVTVMRPVPPPVPLLHPCSYSSCC